MRRRLKSLKLQLQITLQVNPCTHIPRRITTHN
jgi:hypothetical protein